MPLRVKDDQLYFRQAFFAEAREATDEREDPVALEVVYGKKQVGAREVYSFLLVREPREVRADLLTGMDAPSLARKETKLVDSRTLVVRIGFAAAQMLSDEAVPRRSSYAHQEGGDNVCVEPAFVTVEQPQALGIDLPW